MPFLQDDDLARQSVAATITHTTDANHSTSARTSRFTHDSTLLSERAYAVFDSTRLLDEQADATLTHSRTSVGDSTLIDENSTTSKNARTPGVDQRLQAGEDAASFLFDEPTGISIDGALTLLFYNSM